MLRPVDLTPFGRWLRQWLPVPRPIYDREVFARRRAELEVHLINRELKEEIKGNFNSLPLPELRESIEEQTEQRILIVRVDWRVWNYRMVRDRELGKHAKRALAEHAAKNMLYNLSRDYGRVLSDKIAEALRGKS